MSAVKRTGGCEFLFMRGFPVYITVVWKVGVQSGVQRWQNSFFNTYFDDRVHL
jgi:hypothetical protein